MKDSGRRAFIVSASQAGVAAWAASVLSGVSCSTRLRPHRQPAFTPYVQSPLPYSFNTLDPVIDATTMELHYTGHAATYASNLAQAIQAEGVNPQQTGLEQLLSHISGYSEKMRTNAGGHYNHELFWQCMSTPSDSAMPAGMLKKAIETDFNSFAAFRNELSEAAKSCFGSGWAWLVLSMDKKLHIGTTPNEDNPLMDISAFNGIPLLALDVWEHAYYLNYQHRRADYITQWWKVINWNFVAQRYEALV